jgi:uncharacterized phage protein gp47/JayE
MTSTLGNASTGNPVFDYSSRDFASVRADLIQRIPLFLPEWTNRGENDFGFVLIEMFAYVCDLLGYYEDRIAGESFIQTATQSVSIINLAAMLDYQAALSVGSVATLQITIASNIFGPIDIPAGSQFSTQASPSQKAIIFETTEDLIIAGQSAATPSVSGSVLATQGVTHDDEQVATADGTINQTYPLLFNPVSANGFVVSVDLGLGPEVWNYSQSLINSGPFDHVFTNFVDPNGVFYIVFGDGVNGYVPPLGSPITCTYQTDVGQLGNVGAGTIVQSVSAIVGVISVINPSSATGGADAESLVSIKQNAPASLKTLNRAVTVGDIQTLAIQVAGVQWASAQEVTYQLVNLFIAPFGGSAPSAILQAAVQNYVDPLTMANTTVTILPPTYVGIDITVNVVAYPNFGNTSVKLAVEAALAELLSLSNTGFGLRISVGLVYKTILDVPGVNYAIVSSMSRAELVTLTASLTALSTYTFLTVSPLPQSVNVGDNLVINPDAFPTQTVVATSTALAGSNTILVTSFVANANYTAGTTVQDITGVTDAILLTNEIPVPGDISAPTTGGLVS